MSRKRRKHTLWRLCENEERVCITQAAERAKRGRRSRESRRRRRMATLQGWRKAVGALKDSTTVGLANLNSDFKVAVQMTLLFPHLSFLLVWSLNAAPSFLSLGRRIWMWPLSRLPITLSARPRSAIWGVSSLPFPSDFFFFCFSYHQFLVFWTAMSCRDLGGHFDHPPSPGCNLLHPRPCTEARQDAQLDGTHLSLLLFTWIVLPLLFLHPLKENEPCRWLSLDFGVMFVGLEVNSIFVKRMHRGIWYSVLRTSKKELFLLFWNHKILKD